jgi:hypothetical protein
VNDAVFAERNWHDYAARGRAVRTNQYVYIRNDDSERTLSPPADAVTSPTFAVMRRLRDANQLTPLQHSIFDAPRAREELYDLEADPHAQHNLADDPSHADSLGRLRSRLDQWQRDTRDAAPASLRPDEYDRETGERLPVRATAKPEP